MQAGRMYSIEIYDEGERGDANDRKLVDRATLDCLEYDVETGIGKFDLTLQQPETEAIGGTWMHTIVTNFPLASLRTWDLVCFALQQCIGKRTQEPTLVRLRKLGVPRGPRRSHVELDETGDF